MFSGFLSSSSRPDAELHQAICGHRLYTDLRSLETAGIPPCRAHRLEELDAIATVQELLAAGARVSGTEALRRLVNGCSPLHMAIDACTGQNLQMAARPDLVVVLLAAADRQDMLCTDDSNRTPIGALTTKVRLMHEDIDANLANFEEDALNSDENDDPAYTRAAVAKQWTGLLLEAVGLLHGGENGSALPVLSPYECPLRMAAQCRLPGLVLALLDRGMVCTGKQVLHGLAAQLRWTRTLAELEATSAVISVLVSAGVDLAERSSPGLSAPEGIHTVVSATAFSTAVCSLVDSSACADASVGHANSCYWQRRRSTGVTLTRGANVWSRGATEPAAESRRSATETELGEEWCDGNQPSWDFV